jgi:hypothetical protein
MILKFIIFLFWYVNLFCLSYRLVNKRLNNKEVRYIFKSASSSSVGFARYINSNLYFFDLNYSRGNVARRFNNQGFIVGPKGDNITNTISARQQRDAFVNSYNSTYKSIIGINNDYMLITGYGPYCGIPLVTHVNVKTSLLFNGSFVYYSDLASDDTAEQEVFVNGSYKIVIVANAYQNYSIQWYTSLTLLDQAVNLTSYPSLDNVTYSFISGNNYTLQKINGDWRSILAPVLPTEINFFKNRLDSHFYRSGSANYQQGAFTSTLENVHPYCPNLVSCGGSISFTVGENPRVPIAIPPNPLYNAYKENCNDFYPKDTKFFGFGILDNNGATYQRMEQSQERCYAPFYAPELIIGEGGTEVQDERFRQCFMLGGSLANQAQDVCWRPIAWAWCKLGYYYFGGLCYYKFDPILEASARVVLSESSTVCAALESSIPVQAVTFISYDVDAWLRGSYVYINLPQNASDAPFRIPVVDSICNCYVPGNVTSCNCQVPAFPICAYDVKHYEVIDRWIRHSPKTIAILRDGQSGSQWAGEPFNVDCYNGWCDSACERPCCPFPTSANPNDPQSIFFQKCRANGRGSCSDNDPRVCGCSYGYTPQANLMTGEYVDFPCACPAIPANIDLSIVNNVTYNLSNSACGGRWQGTCFVDAFSNTGECDCIKRTRLAATFNLEQEYAYNGKSCASRVPRVFQEADIEQVICNGKGTSCPFGERADGSTAYCPPGFYGCLCDNGYTGEACTCLSPFNLKDELPFARPQQIQYVWCASSDYFLIDSLPHSCTKYDTGKFYCSPIFIKSISNCTDLDAVYDDWFDVGGNYTNPFAGRFSARKENRYYNNYLEVQPWYYATKGCTNTKDMCDSNHTGIGCFLGFSNIVTKAVCGETTLPPRGKAMPNNKCSCNSLGENGYFYDDACSNFVKEYKVCNGKGDPTNTSFPYGTCSADIHLNDSLNHPFFFAQNDLTRFNPWKFKEASLISDLSLNQTYYFREAFTTVYMEKVYGDTFNTCNSSIKLVMPLSMDEALVEVITFNLLLANGTTIINIPVLRGYAQCTGLNQATFYDMTMTRPACYISYTINRGVGAVLSLTNTEKLFEVTCVNAVTLEPLVTYPYGKLYCNNVYQRNIDKALWIFLGEDNYTLQCQNEPIKPYDTPDFYGLFEEYNATRIELALGGKNISLDDLNDKFFDDYLISWVTPYVNRTIADVNYGSLSSAIEFPQADNLILSIAEFFTTGVMYDFLDERWTFSTANGIGAPVRALPYFAPNNTSPYDLFLLGRNYSEFYTRPGIIVTLPSYRRQYQNSTNLLNITQVNSLIFTPPVNLASVSVYARNGTLCGHVLKPRANISYTISCGFDPFLVNDEYYQWIADLEQKANQSDEQGLFSLETIIALLSGLTMEGVRVNIVPEPFYGIELSLTTTGSGSFALPGYKDHCIPSDVGSFPILTGVNGTCHVFNGTSTSPNFAYWYFYDWIATQGWNPIPTDNATSLFSPWFNLSFAQSVYDFTLIWQQFRDLPLNRNVNSSLPSLNCTEEDTKCRIIWHTWLAPRKCTTNEECTNNALGDTCVFPDNLIPPIGWRQGNGDKSLGIEGGCKCYFNFQQGFFTQFCDVCLGGYGPFNNCTLPIAREEVCGTPGYTLNVTQFNDTATLQIVGNKAPACLAITHNDTTYELIEDSFVWLQKPSNYLVSYWDEDGNIINIINGDAYDGSTGDTVEDVTHCRKYGDDPEFFVQYFYDNEKEIEFVEWLPYVSFIN